MILFTIINIKNAIIGGSPVVTKVYFLKFSSTHKSVILFSNKIARQILPKGFNVIHNINNSNIYNIKYFSKNLPALSCAYNWAKIVRWFSSKFGYKLSNNRNT